MHTNYAIEKPFRMIGSNNQFMKVTRTYHYGKDYTRDEFIVRNWDHYAESMFHVMIESHYGYHEMEHEQRVKATEFLAKQITRCILMFPPADKMAGMDIDISFAYGWEVWRFQNVAEY